MMYARPVFADNKDKMAAYAFSPPAEPPKQTTETESFPCSPASADRFCACVLFGIKLEPFLILKARASNSIYMALSQ